MEEAQLSGCPRLMGEAQPYPQGFRASSVADRVSHTWSPGPEQVP